MHSSWIRDHNRLAALHCTHHAEIKLIRVALFSLALEPLCRGSRTGG
jgi:hypothetical protein